MASEQVDTVNTLRAAVRSLRRFFTFGGRDDIISYAIGSQTGKTEEFLEASVATMTDSSGASVDAGNLDRDVIENIMDITMDNSEVAFFICDILTNENLLSRFDVDISADGAQYDGIENYVIFPKTSQVSKNLPTLFPKTLPLFPKTLHLSKNLPRFPKTVPHLPKPHETSFRGRFNKV